MTDKKTKKPTTKPALKRAKGQAKQKPAAAKKLPTSAPGLKPDRYRQLKQLTARLER